MIVGIEEHIAKNWTFGKPLTIPPSIRLGSRTFYTIDDVFLMALANRLREIGLDFDYVQKVITLFSTKIKQEKEQYPRTFRFYDWLVIKSKGKDWSIELHLPGIDSDELMFSKYVNSDAVILINLREIVAMIDERIGRLDDIKARKQKSKGNTKAQRKGKSD